MLIDIPLNGIIGWATLAFGLAAISPTVAAKLSNHLNEVIVMLFNVLVGCLLSGATTGFPGFTTLVPFTCVSQV